MEIDEERLKTQISDHDLISTLFRIEMGRGSRKILNIVDKNKLTMRTEEYMRNHLLRVEQVTAEKRLIGIDPLNKNEIKLISNIYTTILETGVSSRMPEQGVCRHRSDMLEMRLKGADTRACDPAMRRSLNAEEVIRKRLGLHEESTAKMVASTKIMLYEWEKRNIEEPCAKNRSTAASTIYQLSHRPLLRRVPYII